MLKQSPLFLLLMLCPLAVAQNTITGPGAISGPSSGIGQRSGQDVDFKFFSSAMYVRDTGFIPYVVGSDGKLVRLGPLEGLEVGLGAYGRHTFRRSVLGVDYSGNYRHYPDASRFNGSNQQLNLSYVYQKSRRLTFGFTGFAGTQNFSTIAGPPTTGADVVVTNGTQLFDNRTSYLQTDMTTQYALSNRTSIFMGGSFYTIHRQALALVGVNGYNLQGGIEHRIARNTTIGATFQHIHFDFPRAFGESDINLFSGNWKTRFGRSVTLALSGGAYSSAVQGVQSTALDPSIAALLGIGSVQTIFYQENILPIVSVSLSKQFRRSNISGSYARSVTPGNGVYLSSRTEAIVGSYSYTGAHRWSFSISTSSNKLDTLGQGFIPFRQTMAGTNINYLLGNGFNLTGIFNYRHQNINAASFQRDSTRIGLGISFSPGEIPISFH